MPNESEQLVQNYAVDISKLSKEVQRLQAEDKRLRDQQTELNKSFKNGAISATQFKDQMKATTGALKQNQALARDLAGALGGLSPQMSSFANTLGGLFSGPLGIVSVAVAGITAIYNKWKANEEKIEADQKAAHEKWQKVREEAINFEVEKLKASGMAEISAIETVIANIQNQIKEANARAAKQQIEAASKGKKISKSAVEAIAQFRKDKENEIANLRKSLDEAQKKKTLEDLADERKRREEYAKAQASLQEELQKRIEDLQILTIEDTNKQKIAKIELEEKRQLEALDKEYKTATANNKKLIEQAKQYVKQVSELQIKAIKNPTADLTKQLDSATERMEKFLVTYVKHIADAYSQVALSQSELFKKYKDSIYEEIFKTDYPKFLEDMKKDVESYYNDVDVTVDDITEKWIAYKDNLNDIQKEELKRLNEMRDIHSKFDDQTKEITDEATKRLKTINDAYVLEEKRFQDAMEQAKKEGRFDEAGWNASFEQLQQQRAQQEIDVTTWKNDHLRAIEIQRIEAVEVAEQESNERRKAIAMSYVDTWSQAIGGIGELFNALSETEEEGSKKSIRLQQAAIFANMASALAKGISEATSAGWPALLATVPATIAMLVAQFAQVKKLNSQVKFAHGGYVSGPGTGTSDSIDARLSNGEYVVNAKATAANLPLLDAINQSNGRMLGNSLSQENRFFNRMAAAMANVRPVVSVESIDRQRDIVTQVDVLSKL